MINYTNERTTNEYNRLGTTDGTSAINILPIYIISESINQPIFTMSNYPLKEKLTKNYWKLKEIGRLEDDWNRNGAKRFSEDILDTMKKIISELNKQPEIFPTANESIQFEYENNIGDYLEFELFETGELKEFYYGHDDKTTTKIKNIKDVKIEDINETVRGFYNC